MPQVTFYCLLTRLFKVHTHVTGFSLSLLRLASLRLRNTDDDTLPIRVSSPISVFYGRLFTPQLSFPSICKTVLLIGGLF